MNKATNIDLGKIETFFLTVFKQTNDPSILKAGPDHPDYWIEVDKTKVKVNPYSENVLRNCLLQFVAQVVNQPQNGQAITIRTEDFLDNEYHVCLWACASVINSRGSKCYKCRAEATLP